MKCFFLGSQGLAAVLFLFNPTGGTAHAQSAAPCAPATQVAVGDSIALTMKNGDLVKGNVASVDATTIGLNSDNFARISVDRSKVAAVGECPAVPQAPPGSIASPDIGPKTLPSIPSHGMEALTVSMGYTGSASRDESYSAAPTFYALKRNADGLLLARTLLSLSASYDDKWKATPNSSNVTQVYSGKLQELFMVGGSGAFVVSGNAYSNNSQGIIMDQAYGAGGALTFAYPKDKNAYSEFDFDVRGIHDEMYAPGPTVLLAGSNLSFSFSQCFPLPGSGPTCQVPSGAGQSAKSSSIAIKGGVVPVFNRADSWQAYGTFDAFRPVTSTWSVGLTAVDNYFEIAPKGFNKNYVKIGVSIKYVPNTGTSGK
jgi:hypothetical protein